MEASDDVGRCKSRVGNIMKKLRNSKLEIKAFKVRVADKEILKGLNLEIKPGEVHALMGLLKLPGYRRKDFPREN